MAGYWACSIPCGRDCTIRGTSLIHSTVPYVVPGVGGFQDKGGNYCVRGVKGKCCTTLLSKLNVFIATLAATSSCSLREKY